MILPQPFKMTESGGGEQAFFHVGVAILVQGFFKPAYPYKWVSRQKCFERFGPWMLGNIGHSDAPFPSLSFFQGFPIIVQRLLQRPKHSIGEGLFGGRQSPVSS